MVAAEALGLSGRKVPHALDVPARLPPARFPACRRRRRERRQLPRPRPSPHSPGGRVGPAGRGRLPLRDLAPPLPAGETGPAAACGPSQRRRGRWPLLRRGAGISRGAATAPVCVAGQVPSAAGPGWAAAEEPGQVDLGLPRGLPPALAKLPITRPRPVWGCFPVHSSLTSSQSFLGGARPLHQTGRPILPHPLV